MMVCEKTQKQTRQESFAQICQGGWNFVFLKYHPLRPLDRFYYFRKRNLIACISKGICHFSFICHIRKTREHYLEV